MCKGTKTVKELKIGQEVYVMHIGDIRKATVVSVDEVRLSEYDELDTKTACVKIMYGKDFPQSADMVYDGYEYEYIFLTKKDLIDSIDMS